MCMCKYISKFCWCFVPAVKRGEVCLVATDSRPPFEKPAHNNLVPEIIKRLWHFSLVKLPQIRTHQHHAHRRGQKYLSRGEMFISKDSESLPNGFPQRCELLKGSTYSQCPFVSLGSSPAMDEAAGELHMPCRIWNLVMEISSQHRATCSPFSQAGSRSQLGHSRDHANSQQQRQRGSAPIPLLSKAHVPDVPPGKACPELLEHSSRGCQRQTRFLLPFLGFCFSSY